MPLVLYLKSHCQIQDKIDFSHCLLVVFFFFFLIKIFFVVEQFESMFSPGTLTDMGQDNCHLERYFPNDSYLSI